jgi:hypothetical protein
MSIQDALTAARATVAALEVIAKQNAWIVIRTAEGENLGACPWSYSEKRKQWEQVDGHYGLADYCEREYSYDLTSHAITAIYEVVRAQDFEGYPTKIYPVLDDDGALWFTVQITATPTNRGNTP